MEPAGLADQQATPEDLVERADLIALIQSRLKIAEKLASIARAVEAAHARGIIHHDIKPPNIVVLNDGTPRTSSSTVIAFSERRSEMGGRGFRKPLSRIAFEKGELQSAVFQERTCWWIEGCASV